MSEKLARHVCIFQHFQGFLKVMPGHYHCMYPINMLPNFDPDRIDFADFVISGSIMYECTLSTAEIRVEKYATSGISY